MGFWGVVFMAPPFLHFCFLSAMKWTRLLCCTVLTWCSVQVHGAKKPRAENSVSLLPLSCSVKFAHSDTNSNREENHKNILWLSPAKASLSLPFGLYVFFILLQIPQLGQRKDSFLTKGCFCEETFQLWDTQLNSSLKDWNNTVVLDLNL